MAWVIKDSYPYLDTIGEQIEIPSYPSPYGVMTMAADEYPSYSFLEPLEISEPTPYSVMTISNGEYPKYSHLNLIPYIQEPYPIAVSIIRNDEYPHYAHLNPMDTGAFCWAANLEKVVIPESCKYIGVTAFRHTKLKEATIAKDCVYFDTSFPEDCEIKFYE